MHRSNETPESKRPTEEDSASSSTEVAHKPLPGNVTHVAQVGAQSELRESTVIQAHGAGLALARLVGFLRSRDESGETAPPRADRAHVFGMNDPRRHVHAPMARRKTVQTAAQT